MWIFNNLCVLNLRKELKSAVNNKKILMLGLTAALILSSENVFAGTVSSIVKHTATDEVIVKNAADCRGEFKLRFIKKLDGICRDGAISKTRFERLKKELEKLRERTVERIETIDIRIDNLNREKENLNCILTDIGSIEVRFNKVKVTADENGVSTNSVRLTNEVKLNKIQEGEISISVSTSEAQVKHKKNRGRERKDKK